MSIVLNVSLPVFAIILAGVLFGRGKILGDGSSEALNRYVFYAAFPTALFLGTARVPVSETLNWPFLGVYIGASVIAIVAAFLVSRFVLGRSAAIATIDGMTASCPNSAYLGFPLFIAAFGPERLGPAIIGSVAGAVVVIPVLLVMLEILRNRGGSVWKAVPPILGAIARNPMIIGSVAGIAWAELSGGEPPPAAIRTFCELLGGSAGPCALFSIGLFVASRPFSIKLGDAFWGLVMKLVVHPAAALLLIEVAFPDIDPFWGASAVLLAAMPTGGTTFVVAQQYQTGVERTSMMILLTTAVSVVSLTALLAWYGPMR